MKLNFKVAKALKDTEVKLGGIINALGGTYPPPNPKTVVTYQNGDVTEYLIEGELGVESIPDKENAVKIEIGAAVTSIGEGAFYNCSTLTSVIIPDSVISIGYRAFNYCSGLTSIVIPNSVTNIEGEAFSKCSGLTSIMIGNGVTSIKYYAFSGCKALSSIILHRSSAPTVESSTFGISDSYYTGRNTYSSGNNVLKVPIGATGYEATGTAWKDILLDSTKCGFHIEYE